MDRAPASLWHCKEAAGLPGRRDDLENVRAQTCLPLQRLHTSQKDQRLSQPRKRLAPGSTSQERWGREDSRREPRLGAREDPQSHRADAASLPAVWKAQVGWAPAPNEQSPSAHEPSPPIPACQACGGIAQDQAAEQACRTQSNGRSSWRRLTVPGRLALSRSDSRTPHSISQGGPGRATAARDAARDAARPSAWKGERWVAVSSPTSSPWRPSGSLQPGAERQAQQGLDSAQHDRDRTEWQRWGPTGPWVPGNRCRGHRAPCPTPGCCCGPCPSPESLGLSRHPQTGGVLKVRSLGTRSAWAVPFFLPPSLGSTECRRAWPTPLQQGHGSCTHSGVEEGGEVRTEQSGSHSSLSTAQP